MNKCEQVIDFKMSAGDEVLCQNEVAHKIPGAGGQGVCSSCAIHYLGDQHAVHPLREPEFYVYTIIHYDQETKATKVLGVNASLEGAKRKVDSIFEQHCSLKLNDLQWNTTAHHDDIWRLSGLDASVFPEELRSSGGVMRHTGFLIIQEMLRD